MKKEKSLPPIRITIKTFQNMKFAIEKYNQKNLVQLSEAEFRRIAYNLLAQLILKGKELPIELI